MYFKWDLFRRHIKKRVYVAKNGFKWLFLCMGKTHKCTNVRACVRPVLTFYVKVLREVFFIHQEMALPGGIHAPLGTCSSFVEKNGIVLALSVLENLTSCKLTITSVLNNWAVG